MKKAIVTGSTGLIASGVVECLLDNNIEVVALGRREIKESRINHLLDHPNLKYLQLEMSEIKSLPLLLKEINWLPGSDCVFYHFAWSGSNRLADGSIQDQFNNVTYSSNAVIVAKELACKKIINAGSQEENFVDRYLESHWVEQSYHSNMYVYGSTKVTARDMCLLLAYINKIDYVHTRISVILEESLETNNYVNSVLKKILKQEKFDQPLNNQLFDFISKEECAKVYYLLGQNGKNKSNYLLGSGNPMTLHEFFNEFSLKTNGKKIDAIEVSPSNNLILKKDDFNISDLINDIDFRPNSTNFNHKNQ
jgi:nucleoside-diphosphate-sugar epimerase